MDLNVNGVLGSWARNLNEFFPHLPTLWPGFGDKEELRERRTQTHNACASPRPLPNETEISDTKVKSQSAARASALPRAQEFPWVFLAGTQQLHFSAGALEANLTIPELKSHPVPGARGLVLLLLGLCSCCEGVGDGIIKIFIL